MTRNGRTPGGRVRWQCRGSSGERGYCYGTTAPGAPARDQRGDAVAVETRRNPRFKRKLGEGVRTYIISAAQNATPVHPGFFACLQTFVKARRAEMLVIPIRYKNPTSRWTASQANAERWAKEVTPYLWNVRRNLADNLILLGDIKTQPTASEPLTGFDAITGAASGILGHTKLQLKCVATPQNRMAKILTTTGACTVPNYTDSKVGKVGAFHHTLAAVVVEIDGPRFHLRHVHYDKVTGSFIDLDKRYSPDRVEAAPRPLALVMGDTHVDFVDPDVERATFGAGGIASRLRPHNLVWHDLLDGYSINPHHAGNPFNRIAKGLNDRASVAAEVERAAQFVRRRTSGDVYSWIVASNHDDFLRRWVVSHDWKSDAENAEFYLSLALEMVRGTKLTAKGTETPSPLAIVFPHFADMKGIKLLKVDESMMVGGIELSMHGERGPNGARGSAKNLRRIGVKSVVGHSHTPEISEGCYQVGTSTSLRLEYNSGPSAWLNAHCLVHADGKRQLLFIIDGQWRGRS